MLSDFNLPTNIEIVTWECLQFDVRAQTVTPVGILKTGNKVVKTVYWTAWDRAHDDYQVEIAARRIYAILRTTKALDGIFSTIPRLNEICHFLKCP